jgi:hypothetical protein
LRCSLGEVGCMAASLALLDVVASSSAYNSAKAFMLAPRRWQVRRQCFPLHRRRIRC